MSNLEQTLSNYKLTKKQIKMFLFYYNSAVEKKIPYPNYYAMSKIFIWQYLSLGININNGM